MAGVAPSQQSTSPSHSTVDLVIDGRDVGTSVFPEAELKIYLDADATVRARRRFDQLTQQRPGPEVAPTPSIQFDEVLEDIKQRDLADFTRKHSPLRRASDAILIDSTGLTFAEQVQKITDLVRERYSLPNEKHNVTKSQ
ncbi:Cytidylate kinase-domain-containing protein [Dimargaris cristalligena]|uniref:(d)CMP kinase n=1 Tax=Dimargaris cristalligena TaxID=215637 RepID=A0A4P9ZLF5_9FUNG|nr:Cytidylate kinase-domain-containing protein [Dimargaris cristalligena]|eukprot:RKP34124.1 Cytidylate kinase-domain-containing protein [Dimargaris cristalligena]